MPPADRLDTFIEMEEKLIVLRVHYGLLGSLEPKEVLDWAKFLLQWSRVLGEIGGTNSKNLFLKVNKLVLDLSKPKVVMEAYEAMDRILAEAQTIIQEEIFEAAKPRKAVALV